MLLNAPLYLFLFLPVSLGIYTLIPRRYKKEGLFLFCVAYYMLANISNPFAVIVLSVTVVFVWLMTKAIAHTYGALRKLLLYAAILTLGAGVISMRLIHDHGAFLYGVSYPLGIAIWMLSSISCLVDVHRGDEQPPALFDCALYLMFYPVMIAGPIIKFKDSLRLFSDINFTFDNFASGARYYMIGFIKRLAVGAVLFEAYNEIVARIGNEITPLIALVLAVIISTDIYAVFSGYSDMATGVALMYGISLRENFANPLTACTPNQYMRRFMISLYEYTQDYILEPVSGGKRKSLRGVLGMVLMCEAVLLWYRTNWKLVVMTIPLTAVFAVIYFTDLTAKTEKRLWSRILGRTLTFFAMATFWVMLRLDNPFSFFGYVMNFSRTFGDYRFLTLFGSASALKYLLVLVLGIVVMMPATRFGKYLRKKLGGSMPDWVTLTVTCFIMLLFIFTAVFFMPQYPQYATDALGGLLS